MSLIDRFSARILRVGLSPGHFVSLAYQGDSCISDSAFQQPLNNPAGDWQPLLSLLAERLDSETNPICRDVSVVVSSHWCRMMMVPWSDALLKKESAKQFLEAQFVSLYGEEARNWTITTDDVAYGRPRLACAIDGRLLRSLNELLKTRNKRCRSIEPVLSSAWRAISALSSDDVRAFALVEDGRLTMVCAARGEIVAIQSLACGEAWPSSIVNAWQRWGLRVPSIAEIREVVLLNLRADAVGVELPVPFKYATVPMLQLDPAFRFVACGGSIL